MIVGAFTPELESKLSAAVERMPAFPRSVQLVLQLTRDINCKPKDLVAVIERDPVMTMKVLRVINSAYYARPFHITSINQSVIYLGVNTVKNLSLSCAAAGILPPRNDAGFDTGHYLVHSLATAMVARQLCMASAADGTDPGDCYVAGLLHDFGKVVFAQFLAAEFRSAMDLSRKEDLPLDLAECRVIGVDHGYAGAMLAARWNFSESLVDCIRDHHVAAAPSTAILDCLRVADQICREFGQAGNPLVGKEGNPEATARFGDKMGPVVARLGDLNPFMDEARAFASSEHSA